MWLPKPVYEFLPIGFFLLGLYILLVPTTDYESHRLIQLIAAIALMIVGPVVLGMRYHYRRQRRKLIQTERANTDSADPSTADKNA